MLTITKIEEWEITIGDMHDFVTSKVCAATHAIFGNVTRDNPVTTGSSKFRNKPPSRAPNLQQGNHTPVNGNNQKCPLCNAQHWLSHCDEFKKKCLKDLIGTFSKDDENVDDDVYDRFRPGTRSSSTAGNINTLAHRLRGRVFYCRFL